MPIAKMKQSNVSGIKKETPLIKVKKTIAQQREYDSEIVKGRFHYQECPGAPLKFSYKKYKGEKSKTYTLVDGKTYEVPRGIAKHLALNGSYRQLEHSTDMDGNQILIKGRKITRYSFESLGFFDDIEEASDGSIFEVERI